jgi:hypothetical protein
MIFALPDKIVSHAISRDWRAVALTAILAGTEEVEDITHHAPTGIFTGPLEDISRRFTQPAVVLINL